MKKGVYVIKENRLIARGIYRLVLTGENAGFKAPGQFLNIRLDGFFLRRPLSVCDWDERSVTVIYKVLGAGTEAMTAMPPGRELDVLTGLGNGYDTMRSGSTPLLIGGGVGVPPMVRLCRDLLAQHKSPKVLLGFNSAEDIICADEFLAAGAKPEIYTADGSAGRKGLVTDGIAALGGYTFFYACGPAAMLQALDRVLCSDGQYSFEARMGCGFGACMGCTVRTKSGPRRVCRDGPVFDREEVLW